jgi:hypothetical protein
MLENGTISPARIRFSSAQPAIEALKNGNTDIIAGKEGDYYLKVSGITINDAFQVVDEYGAYNERIYMMAVPYMGGYNPDYSGLDFCQEASGRIVKRLFGERAVEE